MLTSLGCRYYYNYGPFLDLHPSLAFSLSEIKPGFWFTSIFYMFAYLQYEISSLDTTTLSHINFHGILVFV